jgi:hypothetical protein
LQAFEFVDACLVWSLELVLHSYLLLLPATFANCSVSCVLLPSGDYTAAKMIQLLDGQTFMGARRPSSLLLGLVLGCWLLSVLSVVLCHVHVLIS